MKRIVSVFGFSVFVFLLFAFSAEGLESCDLSAECAVVMCAQTGEVLFEKNARRRHSMASTTKIMTALLALEQKTPGRIITADADSLNVEGTSMGLQAGDKVTLNGLVFGMLLLSGNDSANLTAKAVGGSAEKFAEMMNRRAGKIGMTDTHFVTPSGLDDSEHYTTAYDMALLGCEAAKNPEFLSVCSKKKAVISCGNPPYQRTVYNHNRLLSLYDGALGMKTGFTRKSGRCLVSCAERDGVMLVAVTLNAPSDWNDHKLMLDYGFSEVKRCEMTENGITVPVTGGNKMSVTAASTKTVVCAENITKRIYTEKFLYAPVRKGDVVGEVRYFSGGNLTASAPLVSQQSVEIKAASESSKKKEKNKKFNKLKDLFRRK